MSARHGGFFMRLLRGSRWSWVNPRFRAALPPDIDASVMALESRDRLHAKQGRSTARVVFHGPDGPLPVYLKRHFRLPLATRVAALLDPGGAHTPGAAEFRHLGRARDLGVAVPAVVAAGEEIGPWGASRSFLMVAELTGSVALNETLPDLLAALTPAEFARLKRDLVREMAEITARLHAARLFHKDLYLCHFFLNTDADPRHSAGRLTLIDLHRLGRHRWFPDRWRWKDLGQLLYSTAGLGGIGTRDALRFWVHYTRRVGPRWPRWQLRMVAWKAARYARHNR